MSNAHPLAQRLIEHLQRQPGGCVLDFAAGSGRNSAALRAAGISVVDVDDARAASRDPLPAGVRFAAALSTHGLLHGTPESIAAALTAIAERLGRGGRLFATFGSSRDARCGVGTSLGPSTYAPAEGPERGIAHTYFDRAALDALLAPHFVVESLEECGVDGVVGSWAHAGDPLRNAVHWFAVARKR